MALIKQNCPELLQYNLSSEIFKPSQGGPKGMAEKFKVPYLGALPLDPALGAACEAGQAYDDSSKGVGKAGPHLASIVNEILNSIDV